MKFDRGAPPHSPLLRAHKPTIVLAVTSGQSLKLLKGFPQYLRENGWSVYVVASTLPTDSPPYYRALRMHRDPHPAADAIALLRWIALLARLRPDIVAVGTPKAGLLGMIAATVTRVPVRIYVLRGLRASTETGLRRRVLLSCERVCMRLASKVQSVSESLRQEAISLRLCDEAKLYVVGHGSSNGVATDNVPKATSPMLARMKLGFTAIPTIGFVGRLTADKGLETLFKALQILLSSQQCQIIALGMEDSPGFMNDALKIVGAETRAKILLLGHVQTPDVYYQAMDVLALPTKREGFPNVVLEAAVAGVPCVASNVTGCRDAVIHEETGLLVPPGDPEELARALKRILDEAQLRNALGNAARDRDTSLYSREDVWKHTERSYLKLMESEISRRKAKSS